MVSEEVRENTEIIDEFEGIEIAINLAPPAVIATDGRVFLMDRPSDLNLVQIYV